MVGAAGKSPRHTLTEHEKRRCLEAMLSGRHERRLRRAEQKNTTGEVKKFKKTRKKAMKLTTVAMEIAESKMTRPVAETAGAVAVAEVKETIAAAANVEAIETSPPSDDSVNDEADEEVTVDTPACVVDSDPNLMGAAANYCTGLNTDEDPEIREEPEDEEDADDDSWDGDWEIGELSDEETDEDTNSFLDSI
ncbi:Pleiotropic drug resistance protein transporter [Phytophthora megakarya]|uniref:Pleiotropic drug resistance protein transporter n=1 Tax=Phytophthora megakarya TaxID=4795 RepID=A0A225VBG8_9STRA|nr:Pleiotropic drug resistance protein transporter [Phytophthora megakarya]